MDGLRKPVVQPPANGRDGLGRSQGHPPKPPKPPNDVFVTPPRQQDSLARGEPIHDLAALGASAARSVGGQGHAKPAAATCSGWPSRWFEAARMLRRRA